MNKKGYGGLEFPWKTITFLLILLFYFLVSLGVMYGEPERNKACEKIGLEEYTRWNEMEICKDKEGNYNFVEIKCNSEYFPIWRDTSCKAKRIKVGEVWGTSGKTANGK